MKLLCKGTYHNNPANLHFGEGIIDVDDKVAEFLMRDAPGEFEPIVEETPVVAETTDDIEAEEQAPVADKALDAPVKDKQVKEPKRKKAA